MNAKLLGSISQAVINILSQFGLQDFQKGRMAVYEGPIHAQEVTVLVGLTQGVRGTIAYSMSRQTACNLASRMMMGMPVPQLDEMAQSAITEMSNMISGHAATLCSSDDMVIDISPPNLMLGDNVTLRTNTPRTVLIELMSEAGQLDLYIGLQEKAA